MLRRSKESKGGRAIGREQSLVDDSAVQPPGRMGKSKAKTKRVVRIPSAEDLNPTLEMLLRQARKLDEELLPHYAQRFYKRALEKAPENCDVLEEVANCLARTKEPDEAAKLLAKSISLEPERSYLTYLNYGQLSSGMDAARHFRKGIQMLTREEENIRAVAEHSGGSTSELESVRQALVSAWSALAEVRGVNRDERYHGTPWLLIQTCFPPLSSGASHRPVRRGGCRGPLRGGCGDGSTYWRAVPMGDV